jgi:hypothetical protein
MKKYFLFFLKKKNFQASYVGLLSLSHSLLQNIIFFNTIYIYIILTPTLEPLGSSRPKLSSDVLLHAFMRLEGMSFSLLCPAQGYPAPKTK